MTAERCEHSSSHVMNCAGRIDAAAAAVAFLLADSRAFIQFEFFLYLFGPLVIAAEQLILRH